MLLTRHPLGQGLLCAVQMYALHPENGAIRLSPLCLLGQPREERI